MRRTSLKPKTPSCTRRVLLSSDTVVDRRETLQFTRALLPAKRQPHKTLGPITATAWFGQFVDCKSKSSASERATCQPALRDAPVAPITFVAHLFATLSSTSVVNSCMRSSSSRSFTLRIHSVVRPVTSDRPRSAAITLLTLCIVTLCTVVACSCTRCFVDLAVAAAYIRVRSFVLSIVIPSLTRRHRTSVNFAVSVTQNRVFYCAQSAAVALIALR